MSRRATRDLQPPQVPQPSQMAVIHTKDHLSANMSVKPNGELLCRNVPIARTGWMAYGPGEIPVAPNPSTHIAYVSRDEATLFDPVCMGSFIGAAVVDDHPEDDVTPANWRALARGMVVNVRRGSAQDGLEDCIVADLLITDQTTIDAVRKGKREVSCGYDADYQQTGVGMGRQLNIIGNHVALVDRGRCGPRCAIGDKAYEPPFPTADEATMTKRVPLNADTGATQARQQARDAARAELARIDAEEREEQEGGVHVHIHQHGGTRDRNSLDDGDDEPDTKPGKAKDLATVLTEGFATMTATLLEAIKGKTDDGEMPEELKKKVKKADDKDEDDDKDEKKAGKAKDSAGLDAEYSMTLANAEILVPGFAMPTFDSANPRKATVDRMCSARRRALTAYGATADGATRLTAINGGKTVDADALPCEALAVVFNAAATAQAAANNRSSTGDSLKIANTVAASAPKDMATKLADLNKANAEYWEKKGY